MKLYARTDTGIGLGIDVQLTGQVKDVAGKLHVEVSLPSGCNSIFRQLPKTSGGRAVLWAYARDLCRDDGSLMDHDEELHAEIKSVNERNAEELRRGPLGENWP